MQNRERTRHVTKGAPFVVSSETRPITFTSTKANHTQPSTRSTNPYATYGPGDGRSWHEYFVDLRASDRADEEEAEVDPEPTVLITARNADPEMYQDMALAGLKKLADDNDWETKIGYSKSFAEGSVTKSGDNIGVKKDDVIREQLWLLARKQGKGTIKVYYIRRNGKAWTRDGGFVRGVAHIYGDKEMKELIKS